MKHRRKVVRALETDLLQQQATQRRTENAGRIARHRIKAHGGADAVRAGDFAEHVAPARKLDREHQPADEAAGGDMPERDDAGERQRSKYHRSSAAQREPGHDESLAAYPFGQRTGERADEDVGQHAGEVDQSHRQRRPGEFEHEHTGRQDFQPAHRFRGPADPPQAAEIAVRNQRPARVMLSVCRWRPGGDRGFGFVRQTDPRKTGWRDPARAGRGRGRYRAARTMARAPCRRCAPPSMIARRPRPARAILRAMFVLRIAYFLAAEFRSTMTTRIRAAESR